MTIRKAGPGDLATVREITRRAYEHYVPIIGGEPMPMGEDYAPRIAAGQVWLLDEGGTVAGLIVLEDRSDDLLIYSVAVAPEHQHGGLGRKLLIFAEDLGRERGHHTIALFTNVKMERNIGIYRRFGFIETRRRAHPTRAGFVVVDMEKKLGAAGHRRSA
jgi:ribosomal protein S18 acetylase RimI-like enzyme